MFEAPTPEQLAMVLRENSDCSIARRLVAVDLVAACLEGRRPTGL